MSTDSSCPSLGMPGPNCEGVDSIGPKPPADVTAHTSSAIDMAISSGAEYFSSARIDSMPRSTIQTCPPGNLAAAQHRHECQEPCLGAAQLACHCCWR